VQAEALRRIQVGLPQQDENPITEPRPKQPRGSGRPRRGAPRPNRPHVTRNTSGSRRVTLAPQLVHYPPDKPPQYTTPKQEPLVGECASRNDGVSAGIEASGAAAVTSLGGDWSGQSGDELVGEGSPWSRLSGGGDSTRPQGRGVGGWGAAQAGGIESNRRCYMFGLCGAGLRVVVRSSGKRRVVVDFDKLDKENLKSAFRYDTLKSLRHHDLAKRGDWAISFDLEDGLSCHSHPPGRQEVLYFFHRWKSIPVRGPSLRLDTKPFCVHQGDAPSGAVFSFTQWRGSAFGGN
jgi:hypothetical protein